MTTWSHGFRAPPRPAPSLHRSIRRSSSPHRERLSQPQAIKLQHQTRLSFQRILDTCPITLIMCRISARETGRPQFGAHRARGVGRREHPLVGSDAPMLRCSGADCSTIDWRRNSRKSRTNWGMSQPSSTSWRTQSRTPAGLRSSKAKQSRQGIHPAGTEEQFHLLGRQRPGRIGQ